MPGLPPPCAGNSSQVCGLHKLRSCPAELNAADRGLQRRKFHLCFSLYLDAARWDFHFVKDERQTIFPSQIFQCSLTKAHPWEVSSAQSWLSQLRPVTPPGVERRLLGGAENSWSKRLHRLCWKCLPRNNVRGSLLMQTQRIQNNRALILQDKKGKEINL